jgi:hypothetical protein
MPVLMPSYEKNKIILQCNYMIAKKKSKTLPASFGDYNNVKIEKIDN